MDSPENAFLSDHAQHFGVVLVVDFSQGAQHPIGIAGQANMNGFERLAHWLGASAGLRRLGVEVVADFAQRTDGVVIARDRCKLRQPRF